MLSEFNDHEKRNGLLLRVRKVLGSDSVSIYPDRCSSTLFVQNTNIVAKETMNKYKYSSTLQKSNSCTSCREISILFCNSYVCHIL